MIKRADLAIVADAQDLAIVADAQKVMPALLNRLAAATHDADSRKAG